MTSVSIEEYNKLEISARSRFSNRVVQAFSPDLFSTIGYPTRVACDEELFKFADVMQESRFEHYIENLLGGISDQEFDLFQVASAHVAQFCESKFGEKGCGLNALAHSLNVLRHINFLTAGRPQRVMEIGPGCGYLGLLLGLSGFPYLAVDVTQAFYLYQNRLWDYCFGNRLFDFASREFSSSLTNELLSTNTGKQSPLFHLPWWEFAKLHQTQAPVVDIVTCNHVLCEMHYDSLAYTLKMARVMLSGSEGPRLLVFEGWGWNAKNRLAWVIQTLYKHGFALVHNDAQITVAAMRSEVSEGEYLPLDQSAVTHGLTWGNGHLYINDESRQFQAPNGKTSGLLLTKRRDHTPLQRIRSQQVRDYCANLVGEANLATDDERFWNFIEHPKE